MPARMSSGSNPTTTHGRLWSRATGSYALAPMMALTCPGQMNPSRARPGSAASMSSALGTVLKNGSTEKFVSPRLAASATDAAMVGDVVSNPTPTNTTSLPGSDSAMSSASSGL